MGAGDKHHDSDNSFCWMCVKIFIWFIILPSGLLICVICGTYVPWHLAMVSLPEYQTYVNEIKHHIAIRCTNITTTFIGKLEKIVRYVQNCSVCKLITSNLFSQNRESSRFIS